MTAMKATESKTQRWNMRVAEDVDAVVRLAAAQIDQPLTDFVVQAARVVADKYGEYHVQPQHGSGPITVGGMQTTGFKGAIAHLAIWNKLLSATEIALIWTAGATDLRDTAMYHSYT